MSQDNENTPPEEDTEAKAQDSSEPQQSSNSENKEEQTEESVEKPIEEKELENPTKEPADGMKALAKDPYLLETSRMVFDNKEQGTPASGALIIEEEIIEEEILDAQSSQQPPKQEAQDNICEKTLPPMKMPGVKESSHTEMLEKRLVERLRNLPLEDQKAGKTIIEGLNNNVDIAMGEIFHALGIEVTDVKKQELEKAEKALTDFQKDLMEDGVEEVCEEIVKQNPDMEIIAEHRNLIRKSLICLMEKNRHDARGIIQRYNFEKTKEQELQDAQAAQCFIVFTSSGSVYYIYINHRFGGMPFCTLQRLANYKLKMKLEEGYLEVMQYKTPNDKRVYLRRKPSHRGEKKNYRLRSTPIEEEHIFAYRGDNQEEVLAAIDLCEKVTKQNQDSVYGTIHGLFTKF